jgi:transposase
MCCPSPLQLRFQFALWTWEIVAELIKRKYGIRSAKNSVGSLLAQLGITPQKPLYWASRRSRRGQRRHAQHEVANPPIRRWQSRRR